MRIPVIYNMKSLDLMPRVGLKLLKIIIIIITIRKTLFRFIYQIPAHQAYDL